MTPADRSLLVGEIVDATLFSQRQVCLALGWSRTSARYRRTRTCDITLKAALAEISAEHPRFGYRRLHVMLRRRGLRISRARVLRLSQEAGLLVARRRKLRPTRHLQRIPMIAPVRPNQGWTLDFTHEQLTTGEWLRILTILDEFTREIILTRAATSFRAADVTACMRAAVVARANAPEWLRSDNGSEFVAHISRANLVALGIRHVLSRPGTPTDNAKIESFHSRYRDELLDRILFTSVSQTNAKLTSFQNYYNDIRPHSSLKYQTPAEFHERHRTL